MPSPHRGTVWLAELPPPAGARPVVVITRDVVLPYLSNVTVVPITRTIRDLPTEVRLGQREGLRHESVASCDNITTIPKDLLRHHIGQLGVEQLRMLAEAVRTALDV